MSIRSTIASWLLSSERKDNPAFAQYATDYGRLPQPVTMGGNPKAFMKEGYKGNATAYKCISYIARNAAEVRLALYADKTKKREITSDPILDLLDYPNSDMSGYDLIESLCSYILTVGNAYLYGLRVGKSGPPDELWSLRPDLIDIVPNGRMILRYDYKIKQPATPFEPTQIGHVKYFNPDDDLYGLSPIQVAAIYLDMNGAFNKWNLSLTQNSAQPPGAWVVPTTMDRKSRDVLEDRLNKKFTGGKNAGRIPVLDGGLVFTPTGIPPAQMAWLEARGSNSNEIASIYSLDPQVVNDTSASTYENMDAAKYGSYTEAIFPLLDKLCGMLNRWYVPMFGKSSKYLSYDKQSVETIQRLMQQQESAKAERYTKIYLAGGMLLADYQEKCGLEPDPHGKVYRLKDLLIAQADLEKYAEQCLTAPATQTLPVPEGTPPPGQTVEGSVTKPTALPAPKPKPKKSFDAHDVYQPDDLATQLSQLKGQGVEYVEWKTSKVAHVSAACDTCAQNDGIVRKLGEPFPSGHILPVAHPSCECSVQSVQGTIHKRVDDASGDESESRVGKSVPISLYDRDRAAYKALLKGGKTA